MTSHQTAQQGQGQALVKSTSNNDDLTSSNGQFAGKRYYDNQNQAQCPAPSLHTIPSENNRNQSFRVPPQIPTQQLVE